MAELYNHIDELIVKHLQQSLTAAEDALLQQWLQTNPAHQLLFDRINNASNINEALATLYTFNEQQGWAKLTAEYEFAKEKEEEAGSSESLVVSMKPKLWKRIAVAASIVAVLFVAGYLIVSRQSSIVTTDSPLTTHDVAPPDKNRAQIKLADGSILYLDSAANGELVNTNGITVTKTDDGRIVYAALTTSPELVEGSPLTYNTLMNPRGSKVQPLTLSDGTKVWLNAESSITYPTAFAGNERKVEITGEAYFEVAHNKSKPFYVSKGNMQVQVLGTHFNVNAYDDENDIKVTLLEGSVKVSHSPLTTHDSRILKPGEQAALTTHDSRFTIHDSPDLEATMSWKNNRFSFKGTDIETIMRQVEKWYDVEVVYNHKIKYTFVADIKRDVPVSELLHLLQLTNLVHFKIEGKKVIVSK